MAYFDGPGGTQAPRAVVDASDTYLFRHNANTHWNYPSSSETDALMDGGSVAGARAGLRCACANGADDGADERARLGRDGSARGSGHALVTRLWDHLGGMGHVTLYGVDPDARRTSTVAFTVDGHDSETVTGHLAERFGVFTSHGDFYATGVTEALGLAEAGLDRAGCACYTTPEEVDRLCEGVAALG